MIRLVIVVLLIAGCNGRPGEATAFSVTTTANTNKNTEQGTEVSYKGIKVITPPQTDVEVIYGFAKNPTPPKTPAQVKIPGKVNSDGGDANNAPAGTAGSFFWGIVLIIVGGLIWLGKRAGWAAWIAPGPTKPLLKFLAMAPKGTGLLVMAVGGFVFCAPWLMETLTPVIIPSFVILGGLAIWWVYNSIKNRRKENKNHVEQ